MTMIHKFWPCAAALSLFLACSGGGSGASGATTVVNPPPTNQVQPYLTFSQASYDFQVPSGFGTNPTVATTLSITVHPGSTPFTSAPSLILSDNWFNMTLLTSTQTGGNGTYIYLLKFYDMRILDSSGFRTGNFMTGIATVTATMNYNNSPINAYCTVNMHF